jgi:signal transduction histidine kinase
MPTNPSPTKPATILLVDDAPANLQLLSSMLKAQGYQTRPVRSGLLALKAARAAAPDLVLLDIDMPEMNGFMVCEQFKRDPELCDIPILFISALNEPADKVRALRAGGVDYVTKPFEFEEVAARVHTHLELARQRQELQQSQQRLQELETLRDSLTHMIVHDMRTPLNVLQMGMDLLKETLPDPNEEQARLIQVIFENHGKLTAMATEMLDVSRLEANQMSLVKTPNDLVQTAQEVIAQMTLITSGKGLILTAPEPVRATYDHDIIQRVITNLLSNALKVTPVGGKVEVRVYRSENAARLAVVDAGPGISREHHELIFHKFHRLVYKDKRGIGLGLTFCKLALTSHGGSIAVESEPGQGSTFVFSLPLDPTSGE